MNKIPVGVSSCLLGHEVRYNGGHKKSRFCVNHLSHVFEFHPFCPEMAVGLGVPRETIRIVEVDGERRVVGTHSDTLDVTDALRDYGRSVGQYSERLHGYILMKSSPSCGLFSAKVYRNDHPLPGKHAGEFVEALRSTNKLLPLEEEGRLNDPRLRENFIARVFAHRDWHVSVKADPTPRALVDFHSRYKFLVMSHGQPAYRALGRLVADAGVGDINALCARYFAAFMEVTARLASRKSHANTLYHLLGYLKDNVSGKARQDIVRSIEDYRCERVNLAVPVELLKHYLSLYGNDYIQAQAYLEPYAQDLGLRNTI